MHNSTEEQYINESIKQYEQCIILQKNNPLMNQYSIMNHTSEYLTIDSNTFMNHYINIAT